MRILPFQFYSSRSAATRRNVGTQGTERSPQQPASPTLAAPGSTDSSKKLDKPKEHPSAMDVLMLWLSNL